MGRDERTLDQHSNYALDAAGRHLRERTTQRIDYRNGVLTDEGLAEQQDNRLQYDNQGRLASVADGRYEETLAYDALGNRTHIHTAYGDDPNLSDPVQSDQTPGSGSGSGGGGGGSPAPLNQKDLVVAQQHIVDEYYRYDAMNRATLIDGVLDVYGNATINASQGAQITYDLAGNRKCLFRTNVTADSGRT